MSIKELIIPSKRNKYEPYLLRKIFLVFYTVVLLFVNYSPLFSFRITQVSAESISSDRLVQLTNQERERIGLNKLKSDVKLTAAASAKANNMFKKQYWDHFGPEGETPWQFIKEAGYSYVYAGENLAKGFVSNEGVHNAWMSSPTHKENIVSPNYQDIGIAVVRGELLGENVLLVVQMFGNTTSLVHDNETETPSQPEVKHANPTPIKVESEEKGSIKSIKITSPKNGSITQNSNLNIKGETEFEGKIDDIDYSVELYEQSEKLDEAHGFNEKEWEYKSEKDLSEGEHKITAKAKMDNESVEDSVEFTVDSTPPIISANSIEISKLGAESAVINIEVLDEDPTSELIIGSESVSLTKGDKENRYYTTVNIYLLKENSNQVQIASSDQVGNIAQVDISEKVQNFLKGIKTEDDGSILDSLKIPSFVGSMSARDWINNGFLFFVAVLLIIEVYYYNKLGKLNHKAYSVFIAVLWLVFLATGLSIGWGNNLTGISTGV